jgi:hypothetical protein
VCIDDGVNLLLRENILPLIGASFVKKTLSMPGPFLETVLFFLIP